MKTRMNRYFGAVHRYLSLAVALSAFSGTADAFQHDTPQPAHGQSSVWDVHFPAGTSMVEVPFREVQGMIIVDVKVNGSGPFAFVIESGWSAPSLLITENIEAIGFDFQDQGRQQGDNRQMGRPVRNVQLELGDLRIEGVNLQIASRSDNEFFGMLPEDGILGVRLFASLVVEVDWEHNRVRLHDPANFTAPADAVPVPLTFRRGLVFATGDVTIDGESQPIKFVVDTGSGGTLMLRSDKVDVSHRRIRSVTLGQSLYGPVKGDIGRIDRLTLGGANLDNMVTRFLDRSSNMVAVGADGNLGNGVLRRFVVTFDYARSRMLLKPTDAIAEPFPFSTSGVATKSTIDDDGSVGIANVYENSPAALAGITVDDRIIAVNSRPVGNLEIRAIRELLKQSPGTRVTLQVRHASVLREVELVLDTVL